MDIEFEARVKPLEYKVKAMSRESPSQKAGHVLDADLRSHWSTATNTKEWILLELNEPCLLSHIRIYNKSVLEWEISVGLRYKPETFVKVRPRCEAPRRDMIYPMNYTPCRYVRISCLRGNPIAIFFIQLIGVSVTGLEPEFQPVVNHLLPSIISHKQDAHDMHLQLLKDMTSRLLVFLPQLEADLNNFLDAAEPNLRFLAMLAGPFYPILNLGNERTAAKSSGNISDSEVSKHSQLSSALTVSSNFEPRRSRGTSPFVLSTSSSIVFRADAIFVLLRKAYKDSDLGIVCRMAARVLHKLIEPVAHEGSTPPGEVTYGDEAVKSEITNPAPLVDYSNLFGEEFQLPGDHWDSSYLNILDIGAVEEGILHVLYACASQPQLCSKLADRTSDFWSALPLVQALLPALRPSVSRPSDIVDDSFSQWKQPIVQQALPQIVATSCSSLYRPLLHACAGYLSSYSPSHAKAACVLIDLCCGVLAPWLSQVIAKVDLAVELLEDLLGVIQGARHSLLRARAALKYVVLALSGHMDDMLGKYKEVKHRLLFLVEMLEPFLDPAVGRLKGIIAFGDLSSAHPEKQEENCVIALNVIRTAVQKPAVLPSLESEWRRGSVAPSVLLSILEPHMQLPPEIDLRTSPVPRALEPESLSGLSHSSASHHGVASKSNSQDEFDGKIDVSDTAVKIDISEDASLLFAPPELHNIVLTSVSSCPNENSSVSNHGDSGSEPKHLVGKHFPHRFQIDLKLDAGFSAEYFNLQADYFQLITYQDCELRASEFRRLALDLHSQNEITIESHDAAIDALLLAAECYVNPFFMMSFRGNPKLMKEINVSGIRNPQNHEIGMRMVSGKSKNDLETISLLERKRDKIVLQILLEAAELDREYREKVSDGGLSPYYTVGFDEQVIRLSPLDVQSADAITLVRQNQALLCCFLIQRLRREQHSMHEILMQCMIFLLNSATKLYCAPEHVIDIALGSAEYLNGMLTSLYYQFKENNLQLEPETIHGIQRRWILLQRLVISSSGGDEETGFAINKNGFRYGNLIPPSAWMQRISTFSRSTSPLVRFLGWMAVSRNARQYMKDQLLLASDLPQLTSLLSTFADELSVVDNVVSRKYEESGGEIVSSPIKGFEVADQQHQDQSFRVIYPDLFKFFPNMKKQFEAFGETILEAVALQLRSLPSSMVPDILCWFSDLCSWPFLHTEQLSARNSSDHLKGYVSKNAKAIILYTLEAIVTEHMEAMVPEIPRVVQVLACLCRASYCDVSFLDSVLSLLKPIISYSLCKVSDEERSLVDDSCVNFESLCFDELFTNIGQGANQDNSTEKVYNRGLTIFILASVFPDLSAQRRREMLQSLIFWADFTAFEPTSSFHDYLCAFQSVMESCKLLLVKTLQFFGAIPLELPTEGQHESGLESHSWFLSDVYRSSSQDKASEQLEGDNVGADIVYKKVYHLFPEEIEEFSKHLEVLIGKLYSTTELCWNLHHQLSKKMTITSTECFMYSRFLASMAQRVNDAQENDAEISFPSMSIDQFPDHWRTGLEVISETILTLQENRCWEVASVVLDCVLAVPHKFGFNSVIGSICSAIKSSSCNAPKIAWRLQSDKWLLILLTKGVHSLKECEVPLANLFCTMLGHPEPEQRSIALKLLGKLVGQDLSGGTALQSSMFYKNLVSPGFVTSVPESIISHLVSSTWNLVVVLASSDASLLVRTRAMTLLVDCIPFAERHLLQSFLAAADSVLGLGELARRNCEGQLLRLSLALIAGACLYSPDEDISLIPQNVWKNIETLASSKPDGRSGDVEKRACQVLCRLKSEGDEAKEVLREVLTSSSSKQSDPDFESTRESVLQVLASLTSAKSYFDIFSNKIDQEVMVSLNYNCCFSLHSQLIHIGIPGLKMNQSRVFRIESKSFSVRTDNLSRGGAILITEKSRGKSFLISLEVDCVVWLRNQLGDALKGSEDQFFRQFKGDSFLFWVERHCNSKGWFLRLSKCTRGVVRSLVIPQGKNAIGWRTMEESLGSLLNFIGKKSLSDYGCDNGRSRSSSFSYRDAVKGSNEVQKGGSRSMGGANRNWDLTLVIERKQVHNSWKEISGALSVSLGRAVHIFPFQPSKAFMDCESGEELQRLLWGSTSLNGGLIEVAFSSWEESWGLNDAKVVSYGGWVAVSGLPLNWWNPKFLSQVGEACGGILQIDRVTDRFLYLHEAKIKVKENNSGFLPQFVKVSEGDDAVFVTISPISPAIKPPSNGKAMVTFTNGRELKSTAIDGVSAFQQDEGQSRSFPVGRADKDGTWRRKDVCTKLGTAQKGGFSALDGVQREKEGKVMEIGTRATHFGNRFSPFINCCLGEDVFLKGSAAPEEFSSLYRVEDFLDDLGVEKVVPITAVFSDSELDFNSTGPKLEKTVPNKHGGSILGAGPVGPVPNLFLPTSKPSRHSDFGPGLFRPSAPPKNPPSASSFFSKYGNGAHTLRRNDPKFFGSFKAKEAAASTDFSDGEEDSCDTDEIDSELELLSDFGDGLDSCTDSVREDLLRGDGSVLDFDDADSSQQEAGEGLDITLCEDGMLEKLFGDLTPTPEMEVIPDFTGKEEGELKIQVDDPGLSNSSSSVSLVGKKDKTGNNSVKIQTYCRRKELPPVPIKKDVKAKHSGLLSKLGISVVPLKKTLIFGKNGGLASACKVQGGKLDRNFVTKSGVGVPKRPVR